MDNLKQQLRDEIPEFRAVGEKFLSGETSKTSPTSTPLNGDIETLRGKFPPAPLV